jgi:hypothetical protein
MKVTLCIWAARAGFSKEHRATLSHHATALHGSDIVYSRDLQTVIKNIINNKYQINKLINKIIIIILILKLNIL